MMTVFLAVLLVLALLGAWTLTVTRGAGTAEGADIMASIAPADLREAYGKTRTEWTILTSRGKPAGWAYDVFGPTESGYEGYTIVLYTARRWGFSLHWKMDKAGESLLLEHNSFALAGVPNPNENMSVVMTEGKLVIQHQLSGKIYRATGTVPDNYLPDPLVGIAYWKAVQRDTEAVFQSEHTNFPSPGGQLPLINLRVSPADTEDAPIADPQAAVQTVRRFPDGRESTAHVFFRQDRPIAGRVGDMVWKTVDEDLILQTFQAPSPLLIVQSVQDQENLPVVREVPDTQPTTGTQPVGND
ncbi:MAG: hypothetical protein ACLFVU_05005 [Phycisphaerae bacterium]